MPDETLYCYECCGDRIPQLHSETQRIVFEVYTSDGWDTTTCGLFANLRDAKKKLRMVQRDEGPYGLAGIHIRHLN